MPTRALKPCSKFGCAELSDAAYCPAHRRESRRYDAERPNSAARGYGAKWRKLRAFVLAREPLCRRCLANGRTTPATEVDHVKPKEQGGTDDSANLQGLCHQCHSIKTATEDGGFGLHTSAKGELR
jgi:5-methylcytosine-specific restriction protein A